MTAVGRPVDQSAGQQPAMGAHTGSFGRSGSRYPRESLVRIPSISPASPQRLPSISPASPQHLPSISPASPSLRPGSQDRKGRLANLVTTPRRLARRSPSSQYLYTLVQGAHRPRHVAAALSPVIPFRKRGSLIVENYFGPGSIPCRITAPMIQTTRLQRKWTRRSPTTDPWRRASSNPVGDSLSVVVK